jgi:TATA-binding protein-associated factor Taf7
MEVEKPKLHSVKAKSMKHGAKRHTVIKKKGSLGVTGANIAFDKKQRAEEKAKKYLQKYRVAKGKAEEYLQNFRASESKAQEYLEKYRAALATAAAAATEAEEDEDEDEEDEEEEEEEEEGGKKPFIPYVPNALDNGMKNLLNALEENAGNNNNSQ